MLIMYSVIHNYIQSGCLLNVNVKVFNDLFLTGGFGENVGKQGNRYFLFQIYFLKMAMYLNSIGMDVIYAVDTQY